MIEEGTPVIAIITDEKTAAHTRSNVQEVIARGANVITIVSRSLSNAGSNRVAGCSSVADAAGFDRAGSAARILYEQTARI